MYRQRIWSPQLGWCVKPPAFPCGTTQSPRLTRGNGERKGGREANEIGQRSESLFQNKSEFTPRARVLQPWRRQRSTAAGEQRCHEIYDVGRCKVTEREKDVIKGASFPLGVGKPLFHLSNSHLLNSYLLQHERNNLRKGPRGIIQGCKNTELSSSQHTFAAKKMLLNIRSR